MSSLAQSRIFPCCLRNQKFDHYSDGNIFCKIVRIKQTLWFSAKEDPRVIYFDVLVRTQIESNFPLEKINIWYTPFKSIYPSPRRSKSRKATDNSISFSLHANGARFRISNSFKQLSLSGPGIKRRKPCSIFRTLPDPWSDSGLIKFPGFVGNLVFDLAPGKIESLVEQSFCDFVTCKQDGVNQMRPIPKMKPS